MVTFPCAAPRLGEDAGLSARILERNAAVKNHRRFTMVIETGHGYGIH
jgi:hypothetical protein